MLNYLKISVVALILSLGWIPMNARSAQEWIDAAARQIITAGSISARFTISGGGHSGSGSLSASGKYFAINAGSTASWYDGKNMWTYSGASKETTLFTPSASELAEVNPLLYIASGSRSYICSMAKGSTASRPMINLVPKSRGAGIRKATVTLNGSTLAPIKMTVTESGGGVVSVSIISFSRGKKLPAKNFVYPKNKYPGIKIIDLR